MTDAGKPAAHLDDSGLPSRDVSTVLAETEEALIMARHQQALAVANRSQAQAAIASATALLHHLGGEAPGRD